MPEKRTPQPGDPFLLDGFEYVLGPSKKELDPQGNVVVLRKFFRPGQLEIAQAATVLYEAKLALKAAREASEPVDGPEKRHADALAESTRLLEADEPVAKNYNYKRDGMLCEADLVWAEPDQLLADLKDQANRLIRGNRNLAAWAEGASDVQEEAIKQRTGGAWVLPDRHLLKPPVQLRLLEVTLPDGTKTRQPREALIVPQRAKEAAEMARAILAHQMVYDTTKEG